MKIVKFQINIQDVVNVVERCKDLFYLKIKITTTYGDLLSESTPIILNMELTHLGSEASIYCAIEV